MNDVLKIARDRQGELRREIDEIDGFISMARSLMQNAKLVPVAGPGRPVEADRDEDSGTEPEPEAESGAAAHASEPEDTAPDEVAARKFPWSGAQPPARNSGTDDSLGPIRRNVFRREAPLAG